MLGTNFQAERYPYVHKSAQTRKKNLFIHVLDHVIPQF